MIPSSSPFSPSSGSPFSSSPFSSSTGPKSSFLSSSSTSSVFGQIDAPPFGNCAPYPFSNSNAMTNTNKVFGSPIPYFPSSSSFGFFSSSSSMTGNDNANSFNGFQLPTSGTSLSPSTPAFGRPPFEFIVPSKTVSASFSGSSSTSSAMQSFPHVRSSVPTFGFSQSCPAITNANAGVASAVGGFSQPDAKTFCGGSLKASYCRTLLEGDSNSLLVSISAMAVYCDKSHEELRLEDYHLRNEGYLPFGDQQKHPISGPKASQFGVSRPEIFGFPPVYSFTEPLSRASRHETKDVNLTPSSGDFGQFHNDQCRGTQIAPYVSTYDSPIPPMILMSISAMFVYHNKSHEELRMEDYQQRNMRASSSAPQDMPDSWCTACKCFQSAVVSQTNQTFNQPANQFRPLQNGSGSTSNAFPGPYQGTTVGFVVQPFGLGTAYGASPLPGFVNFTVPNIGALGSSNAVFGAQQLIPISWTPVFNFPAFYTNAPATTEIPRSRSIGPDEHNGKETPMRSECVLNSDNKVNDLEAIVNSLADVQVKGEEKADSCVPEGLGIIIEKLGFNPWAKGQIGEGTKLDFSRCILPCEEAEKDENISALAQFAVEQHNAMTEDGKVEIVGVIGASLEPVKGGRYHIVLEARDATNANGEPKRYYASVLRNMNHHLAVLEKWLPGKV